MKKFVNNNRIAALSIVGFLLSIFLSTGCDDMNDVQEKYLGKSASYIGTTHDLAAFNGRQRVKLTWAQDADPRITKTIITWGDDETSKVERDFERVESGAQNDSTIIDLPEGTYTFKVYNMDQTGLKSIVKEIQGRSYGEKYEGSLRTRLNSSIDYNNGSFILQWDAWNTTNCIGSKLSYVSSTTNQKVTLDLANDATSTTISNVVLKEGIEIYSIYQLPNTIDLLNSPTQKIDLPKPVTPRIPVGNWTAPVGSVRRLEYLATGAFSREIAITTNVDKVITQVSPFDASKFYINKLGSFGAFNFNPNTDYMMITIDENNAVSAIVGQTSGTSGYTIMPSQFSKDASGNDKKSYYDPTTKKLYLYSMRKTSAGAYTVFEETINFVSE